MSGTMGVEFLSESRANIKSQNDELSKSCDDTMQRTKMKPKDVAELVLDGGSMRFPMCTYSVWLH